MRKISTFLQLQQLQNETMIYAIVVFLIAIVVAFAVANMFPWEGGNDRSYVKRRISFIIIGILVVFGFWLYNDLVVADTIKGAGFQNMFKACNLKCMGITTVGYLIVSILSMFCFRHSKFGSVLGKEKK